MSGANAYAGDWRAGFGVGNAADDWLRLREDVQKVVGEEDLFLVARRLAPLMGDLDGLAGARAGVNLRGFQAGAGNDQLDDPFAADAVQRETSVGVGRRRRNRLDTAKAHHQRRRFAQRVMIRAVQ